MERRTDRGPTVALFVSPHGFGHATRISAVAEALQALEPSIHFEIFTRVPRWLFAQSLGNGFGYTDVLTDIGLVQETGLTEDLVLTIQRLDSFLPFRAKLIESMVSQLSAAHVDLVVCDIAPLGIVAAQAAGIPSVLIENFTWPWIYDGYARQNKEFSRHSKYLESVFDSADHRVRAQPTCGDQEADVVVNPISRPCRLPRSTVRARLGIPEHGTAVLVTMGGVPSDLSLRSIATVPSDTHVVIVCENRSQLQQDNVVFVPTADEFYHPDLVNACDATIGKLGYSTVAEAYHAGIPIAYVKRPSFRESAVLEGFVMGNLSALELPQAALETGDWVSRVAQLVTMSKRSTSAANGSEKAAEFILSLLK